MDGIRAFGPSLHTLEVSLDPPKAEAVDEDQRRLPLLQDESIMMPRLDTFQFTSSVAELLDIRLLQSFPNLTTLDVSLDRYQDMITPHRGWPVLHLPHLTVMSLCGLPVWMFNPASLHAMPRLRCIMFTTPGIQHNASDVRPTLQGNWTWDWNLPKLERMWAQMDLSEAKFSFRFLRGCPNLSNLELEFPDGPAYPLDVSSALTNSAQDIFPNLQTLTLLRGGYTLELEDLRILLERAFPCLRRLHMYPEGSCTIEQVEELTRHHPSMVFFTHQDTLPRMNGVQGWCLDGYER